MPMGKFIWAMSAKTGRSFLLRRWFLMPDLRVSLAGVELKNPIVVASGTYGFGHEYGEFYDLSELGAICVKGLTPVGRESASAHC